MTVPTTEPSATPEDHLASLSEAIERADASDDDEVRLAVSEEVYAALDHELARDVDEAGPARR